MTHDDYLWDRRGDAEPDVVALERALAPLRYEAEPLRLVRADPARQRRPVAWSIPVLAGAAAAAMVLLIASRTEPGAPEVAAEFAPEPEKTVTVETVTVGTVESPPAPPRPPASPESPAFPESPASKATSPDMSRSTLSTSEVRRGIAKVRARAIACGSAHGLEAKTTVKVKLRIAGSTGRVTRAQSLTPWASTPLGACVATAVSKARFPRFGKTSMSVVYPIRIGVPRDGADGACARGRDCAKQDSDLPATLSSAQLRAGMLPIKPRIHACAVGHDAPSGTRVRVKLSVAGETGRVTSATAMAPWTDEPLGHCVESAVRTATFPKFRKARLGAVYPFTLSVEAP
ncbi:MAG: hypothetical protein ACE37F_28775 [Nannocystaceae bacterium]|nr:hypothetical protein [bacterium]